MRRILLATAALALVSAGSALASDSTGVQITATVAQNCVFTTPPSNIPLVGTTTGSNGNSNFVYKCNFSGVGAPIPLTISFSSLNGGLENPDDNDGTNAIPRGYSVVYNGNPAFTSLAAFGSPQPFPETSATPPNTPAPRAFNVALTEDLPVAGAYADTLTVSIVP